MAISYSMRVNSARLPPMGASSSHSSFFRMSNELITVPSTSARCYSDSIAPKPVQAEDRRKTIDEELILSESEAEGSETVNTEKNPIQTIIPNLDLHLKSLKERPPLRTRSSSEGSGQSKIHLKKNEHEFTCIVDPSQLKRLKEYHKFSSTLRSYIELLIKKSIQVETSKSTRGIDSPSNLNEIKISYSQLVHLINSGIKTLEEENDTKLLIEKSALNDFYFRLKDLQNDKLGTAWCVEAWGKDAYEKLMEDLEKIKLRRQNIQPIQLNRFKIIESQNDDNRCSLCSLKSIHDFITHRRTYKDPLDCKFSLIRIGETDHFGNKKIISQIASKKKLATSDWYAKVSEAINKTSYAPRITTKKLALQVTSIFSLQSETNIDLLKKKIRYFPFFQCLAIGGSESIIYTLGRMVPIIKNIKNENQTTKNFFYQLEFRPSKSAQCAEIWVDGFSRARIILHTTHVFTLSILNNKKLSKFTPKKSKKNPNILLPSRSIEHFKEKIEVAYLKLHAEIEDIESEFKTINLRINDLFLKNVSSFSKTHKNQIIEFQKKIYQGFISYVEGRSVLENGATVIASEESPAVMTLKKLYT